jgi:hypothetical protein
MATKVRRNRLNFKGKMVSIGVDMHRRSWYITAPSLLYSPSNDPQQVARIHAKHNMDFFLTYATCQKSPYEPF